MSAPAPTLARKFVLVALGLVIGCYSTLCGIGGGVFAVPLLHYVYGMELPIAVANSLVLVAASTTSATLLEVLRSDSGVHWRISAVLIATSYVGARLGYAATKRIDVRRLKLIFCVLLVAVALNVILNPRPTSASAPAVAAIAPGVVDWLVVAATGFVAGFVAPMLGIGGGLVAVPGLLYGVPALGYLGARACSMAMSMFTSWHSVWLYRRDGSLRTTTSIWLALGALVGAALGIQLIHVKNVAEIAQSLVAFALFFAAARFAWDVWLSSATRSLRRR